MEKLKGSEVWRFGERCVYCGYIIGASEDAYVIAGIPLHASCVEKLLAMPEGEFAKRAEGLPQTVREELAKLRRGTPQPTQPQTPKPGETPPEAELPETVILTREARAALWSRAKLIVSSALKAAEVRYVGEMRIDGMSPPHYSKFLFAIRDEIGKLLKEPKNVEFRVHTYMKGYADTDIFVGGEYFGTWRPPDPYVGAFWNWVHRIYNLLKYLGERGLLKEEVIKSQK
jgi:hypothetical protein